MTLVKPCVQSNAVTCSLEDLNILTFVLITTSLMDIPGCWIYLGAGSRLQPPPIIEHHPYPQQRQDPQYPHREIDRSKQQGEQSPLQRNSGDYIQAWGSSSSSCPQFNITKKYI
ncbi:hypothetical protein JOB18_025554 [Solea senegalensis]|uniref:Uncharacterized protein n=1 Tax=Solea senegalensis TaxID=28829 RepID=A0AAV6PM88_SOLSE|nr:hypothetical protein JOB18_025554 [Solea senegalensis]